MRKYFSRGELILWGASAALVTAAFLIFDPAGYLTYAASLIGVTSLIFNARGNPVGQALMVIFSCLYGVISWTFRYYGEMITYLGMTGPMALFALIAWLKNPYRGNRAEVAVNRIPPWEWGMGALLTAVVTLCFYYILAYFNTAYLLLSTLSVATSFAAVYLTFRRSRFFALAYALNDIVLIALWVLASIENSSYLSVCICFTAFLANDIYSYIAWSRMARRQRQCGLLSQNMNNMIL